MFENHRNSLILQVELTFVFTNFISLCTHEKYLTLVENLIIGLISAVALQVRQKASKILCGLLHSQFIDTAGQKRLLSAFTAKIKQKSQT